MQQGKQTNLEERIDGKSSDREDSPGPQQKDANGVQDKEERATGLLG